MAQGLDPIGSIVENLFTIQRIGNSINEEGKILLNALFNQVVDDLRTIDPTAPSLQKWKTFRTEQFIEKVGERVGAIFPDWEKTVRSHLAVAGRAQGEFASGMLAASLGTTVGSGIVRATPVTQNWVKHILDTFPFGGADGQHVLSDWSAGLKDLTRNRIVKQMRIGMTLEESIPEMVRRIRGTQAGWIKNAAGQSVRNFVGGVWKATTRDAEAIVRTGTTYVMSTAHLETFKANASALLGIQYSATLDDRTTVICLALDGTIWPVDSVEIVVPGDTTHVGCRSTLVPVPDYEKFGLEPPPDGFRKARDLSGLTPEDLKKKISTRRGQSLLGKQTNVSSKVVAEDWLRQQPEWIQNRSLGAERARLFREGKVSLKDMIRADNSVIPTRDLPGAFTKYGKGAPGPSTPLGPSPQIPVLGGEQSLTGEELRSRLLSDVRSSISDEDLGVLLERRAALSKKYQASGYKDAAIKKEQQAVFSEWMEKKSLQSEEQRRLSHQIMREANPEGGLGSHVVLELDRTFAPEALQDFEEGWRWFRENLHRSHFPPDSSGKTNFFFREIKSGRAWADPERNSIFFAHDGPPSLRSVVHELGHMVEVSEQQGKNILRRTIEFWERRTKGDSWQNIGGARRAEWLKEDRFPDKYAGKVYSKSGGKWSGDFGDLEATEILSMGLEKMFDNPYKFALEDPEFFDLIWEVMSGRIRP